MLKWIEVLSLCHIILTKTYYNLGTMRESLHRTQVVMENINTNGKEKKNHSNGGKIYVQGI